MKKRLILIFALFLILPISVFAEETDSHFEVVAKEEKYYKTTTIYNSSNGISTFSISLPTSYTEEVTKEEFNSYSNISSVMPLSSGTIETTYKKLTTTISSNGSYYRYKSVLTWQLMPKVRSYDIIGIGHYASVKIKGTPSFSLYYCTDPSECYTSTSATKQIFDLGASATFKLPTGTLTSLKATYYYDVEKNVDATILTQKAYGDYSHATSTISLTNAKKHSVSSSGIYLDSTITDYYDNISVATATWMGSW